MAIFVEDLKIEIAGLCVFKSILADEAIRNLTLYLDGVDGRPNQANVFYYSNFVAEIYKRTGGDWTEYLKDLILYNDNIYARALAKGLTPAQEITECVEKELSVLQSLFDLRADELIELCDYCGFMPKFSAREFDIKNEYLAHAKMTAKSGFGVFAKYPMFYLGANGEPVPIKNFDNTKLDYLLDYNDVRERIITNTRALLDGKPALNVLLTGDAGTGKSSTIKAIVNEFFGQGLRLIQVDKDCFKYLFPLLESLATNPLKFIIFIDDLTFNSDDEEFNQLKALLEGSAISQAGNVAVYATSNRRHIVREKFADRDGDDVHVNDAIQEMISLSNRFGLHITYNRPNKKEYLNIVKKVATDMSVDIPDQELFDGAERLALSRGGRSARLAKQYVDGILLGLKF